MQVAILAGGLATRLRPITETLPKSMVEIEGKPFLHYQIEFLKRNGVTDLVLCVGYLSEQIEHYFGDGHKWGVSIRYVHDGKTLLGTAGALKRSADNLDNEFFVMYGDSYVFLDFKDVNTKFMQSGKPALMVVYRNDNRYDMSNVAVDNGLVTRYDKKNSNGDLVFIDYGVLLFSKKVLDMIPGNQVYPLEKVVTDLIQQKELAVYETKNRFYEIGSHTGLDEFTKFIKDQQNN